MTRSPAELPDQDIKLAAEQGKSCAAVSGYLRQSALDGFEASFGLWARHGVKYDPQDYDRKRRAEWTRYWDDDYEEVRAESPDLFDEEDDRQRQIHLDMIAGKYPEFILNKANDK
jgi:hypothetical protein